MMQKGVTLEHFGERIVDFDRKTLRMQLKTLRLMTCHTTSS